jgi:hypothetical protein
VLVISLSVPQEKHVMTMFSSCPGNMWSARSSAPVHQIHNQPLKVVMWFPRCRSQRGTHPSDHPVRSAQHTFVDRRAPQGPLGADANLDNLILVCYRHHWMLHEGGWQLAKVEHGRLLAIPTLRRSSLLGPRSR